MTSQWPQRQMPCHLGTHGTRNKECTSLDGTNKGESTDAGSFPIIIFNSVVFVTFLCVHTLSIISPLTAALPVLDWILEFHHFALSELGSLWTILLFHQEH